MLQTVQKIGPLLDLFSAERPEWGVSEAASAVGVPRSSMHALMTSLVEIGLLSTSGRGRYRLGWRIVELYEIMRGGLDLRAVAAPVLSALNEETGETVNLAVLDRGEVLYLDKVASRLQLSVHGLHPGARIDPHANALGKVLLAFSHPAETERIVHARPLKRFTPATIVDPDALLAALAEIRRAGVGYEDGEIVADVACVAAPVRDPFGALVGAVSVTVPAPRMTKNRAGLTRAVRSAATEIGRRLAAASDEGPALPSS